MPARRLDHQRLLAAVNAQAQAVGWPAGNETWSEKSTVATLGAACVSLVGAAFDQDLEPQREALRGAVIYSLDVLAGYAPGRAVEVRVPPFGAVQVIDGPRHTRGTPPNVVETDPLTWVRMATGRLDWAAAVASGAVRTSGPRADLADYLPLSSPPDH